jgi:UDP-N-acetylglucosamine--N-acetylmuramyl-(pentapeptide) pyrophosphoryl-undecaprenol N-acetylglucosamine transferase
MVAAGGTGGHVYPALAVAEAVRVSYPDSVLYFVGTVGGFERPLLAESGVPFAAHDEVQAGPIHGVNPLRMISSIFRLMVGTVQALRLLGRHKPDTILSTGGWVGFPVAFAAWLRRVPVLIYLPDIEPGMTIKVLRRFARRVAITVPDSAKYFKPGQTVVTGYPLRPEMLDLTREQSVAALGLDASFKTLLIFGGSRGARAINIGLIDILPSLLQRDDVQIVHITGTLDADRAQEQVAALGDLPHTDRYHARAYLHGADMAYALCAADLVVCRAGASTLGEFPAFGLPSILIPLAYAWRYQQINADYLADHGAAVHLPEEDMAGSLLGTITGLLDDPARLDQMRDCALALAQPDGAANVARALAQLAGGTT